MTMGGNLHGSNPWHCHVHSFLDHCASAIQSHIDAFSSSLRSTHQLAIASASHTHTVNNMSVKRSGPREVVSFLAANPSEIKARLAGVPIYAVVNQKKEFILVSGDDDTDKQMSLLFFSKADAQGFHATIKKENPKLGKTAQVLATSLESVYELVHSKRGIVKNGDAEVDVSFRFMPDSRQVLNALELYKKAGIPKEGFVGVPLFQAEGLTVRGDSTRYTPLFFSKNDLDAALVNTQASASGATVEELKGKIERVRADIEQKPEKKGELSKRLVSYEKKLKEEESSLKKPTGKGPRIDVGSFEDVLEKMINEKNGAWNDVCFVPSGSLNRN
jgi:hypothetical protein